MTLDHLRHSTPVLKPALALALLLVMVSVLLVSACGSTDPTAAPTPTDPVDPDPTKRLLVPTPTPHFIIHTYPYHGTTSLEERIFHADVIAHVRPVSVLGKWKTIPSDEGVAPTYLPFLEIGFKPIEYLKGSGDTQIIVEEPGRGTYLTKEMAQENADQMLRHRAWNDDEAVVFLEKGLGASGPEDSRYRFVLSKLLTGFWGKYALDSDNKAWLPRDDSSRGDPVFLTDSEPSGERGVLPVISLKDLRSSIEAVDTLVKDGEGIDGYEECLVQQFRHQRHRRAREERIGRPFTPPTTEVQIASGLPAGSEFHPTYGLPTSHEGYSKHWITGPDEDLFLIEIYDPDGDPGAYQISNTTTRPLPGGAYMFDEYLQLYIEIPCNYKSRSAPWVVSVESPEGTLHEAFFDPVEVDGMIRASTDDGVIEPGTFVVRDVETTIASLTWEAASSSMTMELDPYVSLAGHAIDFIALDGSVSLSLDFDEASVKRVSGALTWRVSNRPWQAGDKLMIRIRE